LKKNTQQRAKSLTEAEQPAQKNARNSNQPKDKNHHTTQPTHHNDGPATPRGNKKLGIDYLTRC
jgi:hypothetical protein